MKAPYAYDSVCILGPTACGKTALACALADEVQGEIISADSRQVYRGMDIGTGKDLSEYVVNGRSIPYHLIDIRDAGEKYNLYEYQHDFHEAFSAVCNRGRLPVICGGSGLYIEAVLKGFRLFDVAPNPELRRRLQHHSLEELTRLLRSYKELHNTTDVDSVQRAIRAIEIAEYTSRMPADRQEFEGLNSLIVGVEVDRDTRRQRISSRLEARFAQGMLDEVQGLLDRGIQSDDLIYYGLEYKFLTRHLLGEISYRQMFDELEIAIHQFAKRQMTWFRGMERRGLKIHWLPWEMPTDEKLGFIAQHIAPGC